jgi:hypothetical protein
VNVVGFGGASAGVAVVATIGTVATLVAAVGFVREWRSDKPERREDLFAHGAATFRTGGRVGSVNATWPLVRVDVSPEAVRIWVPLARARVYHRSAHTRMAVRRTLLAPGPLISFEPVVGSRRPSVEVYATPRLMDALVQMGWMNEPE